MIMEEIVQEKIVVERQPAITDEALGFLKSSTGWAQFLAVVNFICCGLLILFGIILLVLSFVMPAGMMASGFKTASMGALTGGMLVFMSIFYLVMGGIGFVVAYYLYKFASASKRAVLMKDSDLLTQGIFALNKYFKITGILTIAILVLTFMWIPISVIIAL